MNNQELLKRARKFIEDPPYKNGDFAGKNWGHKWHSLCSYQGKLKPAIAHFLITEFTEKGDIILDPLCGVGTIPFEACLNGRIGLGNDLSRLAYVVSYSKLYKPEKSDVYNLINDLKTYIENEKNNIQNDIEMYGSWGFNGKLNEYYEAETFKEILCARRFFKLKFDSLMKDSAFCFVFSCYLHILHGNRPYALSRTSHPLTPYYPKGEFIYKDTIQHVIDKVENTYKKADFIEYRFGDCYNGDYLNIPNSIDGTVDAIITSPPFANSIRFYINNWLRLWFAGWEPSDFKIADNQFLDGRQDKDFDIYLDFFDKCSQLLKDDGIIVLHLGKTKKVDMAYELSKRLQNKFEIIFIGEENVDNIEHHGIKDKGGTFVHQFMFLRKQ